MFSHGSMSVLNIFDITTQVTTCTYVPNHLLLEVYNFVYYKMSLNRYLIK